MSLEKLVEDARNRYSPAKKLYLAGRHQERTAKMETRLAKEFKDSEVTEELLNKRCTL